jgi:hypothetical protein
LVAMRPVSANGWATVVVVAFPAACVDRQQCGGSEHCEHLACNERTCLNPVENLGRAGEERP